MAVSLWKLFQLCRVFVLIYDMIFLHLKPIQPRIVFKSKKSKHANDLPGGPGLQNVDALAKQER